MYDDEYGYYNLFPDGYPDELIPEHCFTNDGVPDEQDPDTEYYYPQAQEEKEDDQLQD